MATRYCVVSRHPQGLANTWTIHSRHRTLQAARTAYRTIGRAVRARYGAGSYLPGLGLVGVSLETARQQDLGPQDAWTWEVPS